MGGPEGVNEQLAVLQQILRSETLHPNQRVSKIGVLIESSDTQWHQDVQASIEKAIQLTIKTYIKVDIQRRNEKYTDVNGNQQQTPVLTIQVPVELSEVAIDGLSKIFANGVISPVGRRMSFIPTQNMTSCSQKKYHQLMARQKELNTRQRQKHINAIQEIRREVTTLEGKKLTIQQVTVASQIATIRESSQELSGWEKLTVY